MARRDRGRAAVVAALVGAVTIAACGTPSSKAGEKTPEPTSTPKPEVSVPVVSEDHAMPQPPKLTGGLAQTDVLIYAAKPLSSSMVKKIEAIRVKGKQAVHATELFSLASPSIQGQTYQVAAVDPATFRRFSPAGTQAEIWSRLAAGEMVVSKKQVTEQIELEPNFVEIGSDDEAEVVHVGAFAPQPANVQMVVNESWGDDLFDVHDNALLISAGDYAPQAIRGQIEKIVKGTDASVQMLDVASVLGLDPDATYTAVAGSGSVSQAIGVYRYRVNGTTVTPDSGWVAANLRTEVMPIVGRVTCHKVMLLQLRAAMNELVQRGLDTYIRTTAGCYNARFIANTTSLSNHAFGMAIDFDAAQNGRGTSGQIPPVVVDVFKKWGFAWGGDWKWTDPMHFELVRIMKVV
ncbi:M15 family metallopeptidase [Nocardioides sp.]|uniref:M15 family metallopeptidase n=1 Tax=Nocardioides sp. TaxID=35761 RepID=UPI002C6EE162|nr:M15 family metallopeptidase [Nocardioides sp.]HSX67716.1 M15 family metallopeptidase [Nocardioides sp.]